ncbi:ATP-dependent Clp protease proteolytic subunit [Pseudomonas oryzihabitans]|uniref:ATP-dependent Clp protease proteolytic subunit n=1 Tax=Pseudomonas oryzihabitans TaxID=47885 RepID=UPI003EBBE8CD
MRRSSVAKRLAAGALVVLAAGCLPEASAEMAVIRGEGTAASADAASVYFNSGINDRSVSSLLAALSDIALKYPATKNVDLYLNSPGGSMEADYVAYEFIRHYPLHINTIDAAATDSSATMIYCAAEDRYAAPLASFLLHPAAAAIAVNGYMKPDQAKQAFEDVERENLKFREIYKGCLKLAPEELTTLLSSESNRRRLGYDAAKDIGLITRAPDRLPRGTDRATYFVSDGGSR